LKVSSSPAPLSPQERYARWLERGTRTGLVLLVVGLVAYVFELVTPHVPIERLPALWGLPAHHFLEQTRIPRGWGWAALAHRGDLMNLAGIAVLAGCSVLPLAAAVLDFRAHGERFYSAVCALEIVVLLLAASGLLVAGH
jgi:hypothetical protein